MLECINKKSHKFIKRPVLTNSHKFLTRIKVSLYGVRSTSSYPVLEHAGMKPAWGRRIQNIPRVLQGIHTHSHTHQYSCKHEDVRRYLESDITRISDVVKFQRHTQAICTSHKPCPPLNTIGRADYECCFHQCSTVLYNDIIGASEKISAQWVRIRTELKRKPTKTHMTSCPYAREKTILIPSFPKDA